MKGIKNLSQIITLEGVHKKGGRRPLRGDLCIIENGSIVFDEDKILWVGSQKNIPKEYENIPFIDGSGHILTPEVVDSHTHLVFGGNRAREYGMRLDGADYQEIANAGGGILSSMKMTNEASFNELFESAKERIKKIHSYGVGTIEIKSGYGLNIEKEIECSRVIKKLKEFFSPQIQIFSTFMPAHAIPKTWSSPQKYMEDVVYPATEQAAKEKLFDAIDIFHEEGYFGSKITKEYLEWCQSKDFAIKMHVDEFNDNGGAEMAHNYKALSADHLLCVGKRGIKALSKSDTIATILPGTGFFLGKNQAPAKELIEQGAKLSIASDYNPGSCHCDNLILIASLAAPQLKLNLAEVWTGITYNAAASLGLTKQGVLVKGFRPRFSLFRAKIIDEITYNWGHNLANSDLLAQAFS